MKWWQIAGITGAAIVAFQIFGGENAVKADASACVEKGQSAIYKDGFFYLNRCDYVISTRSCRKSSASVVLGTGSWSCDEAVADPGKIFANFGGADAEIRIWACRHPQRPTDQSDGSLACK